MPPDAHGIVHDDDAAWQGAGRGGIGGCYNSRAQHDAVQACKDAAEAVAAPPRCQRKAACIMPAAPAHLKHTQTANMGLPSPCCIAMAVATEEQSEEWEEGMPPLSKNARTSQTPVLYAWRKGGQGRTCC